jgi:hypothetical protein
MALNVERLVQRHIDRWVYLLGLGSWHITWEVTDRPIAVDVPVAQNDYYVRRTGRREAHIRFDRFRLRSARQVEGAVVHELLHLYDHGIGNDAHKLIERLETPLVRVRRRASR